MTLFQYIVVWYISKQNVTFLKIDKKKEAPNERIVFVFLLFIENFTYWIVFTYVMHK